MRHIAVITDMFVYVFAVMPSLILFISLIKVTVFINIIIDAFNSPVAEIQYVRFKEFAHEFNSAFGIGTADTYANAC
ncbi:MAG: hypothetical protein BWZ04_02778 [Firmicutes bacterium ADurb.BinA205]|nr:MAG: hypothetical protein BWZ04_02778 [Firmicutes bacterium ADurb.BinA205]